MLQLTARDLFQQNYMERVSLAFSVSRSIHFHFAQKAPSQLNSSPSCFRLSQLISSGFFMFLIQNANRLHCCNNRVWIIFFWCLPKKGCPGSKSRFK